MTYQSDKGSELPISSSEADNDIHINSESSFKRSFIGVTAFSSLVIIAIFGLKISQPFASNVKSQATIGRTSLAAAHAALGLQPDEKGRYEYKGLDEDGVKYLFNAFTETYEKDYKDEDMGKKYTSFKSTLTKVDERNARAKSTGSSTVHGLTKFSDMSDEEFKSTLLKAQPPEKKGFRTIAKPMKYSGSGSAVMWDGIYTTAVRDQGYCGSCWAFSTAQQLESDAIRLGLIDTNTMLSPQQILSCDKTGLGCDGGWTEKAYDYVQKAGGLALDQEYKYTAYNEDLAGCQTRLVKGYVSLTGYASIEGEADMIDHVMSTGPLSVCLDSTVWNTYVSGVVQDCGNSPNHCVQVVGVDLETDGGYWKVRTHLHIRSQ
jgi:hypothetical protein